MPYCQRNKSFSPSFHFKVFFENISSKLLKRLTKDSEFRDIFQVSVKSLLKYFSCLDRRGSTAEQMFIF